MEKVRCEVSISNDMYVGEQQIKYFESYKYMEAIIGRDKTLIRQQIKLQYKIHSLL